MLRSGPVAAKLVIIGSAGVGKTCLVDRFLGNDYSTGNAQTISASFSQITVKLDSGEEVALNVWDTAGEERYQSISHSFYRDSDVALICCSTQESAHILQTWVTALNQHAPADVKKFVALTKIDLIENDDDLQDVKAVLEAQASGFGIESVFTTSALTGHGCDALLNAIAESVDLGNNAVTSVPVLQPATRNAQQCDC